MIRRIIIFVVIIVVGVGWYLGAYTPFVKSKKFIETIRSGESIRTVDDLKFVFERTFKIYSPIAQDEVLSFFADQMVNILSTKPPKEVGIQLIDYTISRLQPVLDNPKSPELTKAFIKAASVSEIGWINYQEEKYFEMAEYYLLEGLKISPNRSQNLYGLFNLYLSKSDFEKAREVGEKIIVFWPDDNRMRQLLDSLPGE